MQDHSEEYIIPQIKSVKLREYLSKHPDLLRALTPPRSGLSHSKFYNSAHNSMEFLNNDIAPKKLRKSGSFDVIRPIITVSKSEFFSNTLSHSPKEDLQIGNSKNLLREDFQINSNDIDKNFGRRTATQNLFGKHGKNEDLLRIRERAKALDLLIDQNPAKDGGSKQKNGEGPRKEGFSIPHSTRDYNSPPNYLLVARPSSPIRTAHNSSARHLITETCKTHNNSIFYICTKDSCGELLCPLCLYEHQKHRHIGDYELLNEYRKKLKNNLGKNYDFMIQNIEKIVELESLTDSKTNFDTEISDEIDRLEQSLLRVIKQFFQNIREEYKVEIFFEYEKIKHDLNDLHEKMNSIIQNIEGVLEMFSTDDETSISSLLISQIVQRNYFASSQDIVKNLNGLTETVKHYMERKQEENKSEHSEPLLEINSQIKFHLNQLLGNEVKIFLKKQKSRPNPQPNKFQDFQSTHREKNKSDENEDHDSLFSRDPDFDLRPESPFVVRAPRSPEKQVSIKQTHKTISPFKMERNDKELWDLDRRLNDGISNAVLEIYKTISPKIHHSDKDLDIQSIKGLMQYMSENNKSSKIKTFDHAFFEQILSCTGPLETSTIEKGKVSIERSADQLGIEFSSKHKSVFTAYDRLFFLMHTSVQWILIEIRTNPKMILIYDCLGKISKSRLAEGIFSLMYEVIKFEYKVKLNQNPESYAWEKKFVLHPTLVSKTISDSLILAIKIISNAYQNKEFTNIRIGPNEINMIKKKIERVLKERAEKKEMKYIAI